MMIVRPEITYRTSVLQPIGGFEPHQAIEQNVADFTLGPSGFQAGGLSGPSYGQLLGNRGPIQFLGPSYGQLLGPFDKLKMWWGNIKARVAAWGLKKRLGLGFTPYGPRHWAGGRVVPMAAQREQMMLAMNAKLLPQQFSPITQQLGFTAYRNA